MHRFENFTDLFRVQGERYPQKIALHLDKRSITYLELDFFIWKMSTFLYKNGIRSGNVVSLSFNNEFTMLVTMLAVARIGATVFVLPIRTPSLLSAQMVKKVNSKIRLTDIENIDKTVLPFLHIDIKNVIQGSSSVNFNARNKSPKDYWIIVTGSGTTGESKMMPITHKQQLSRLIPKGDWCSESSGDCFASLMYLNHYTAIARSLATFYFGGSIVIDRSIHPVNLVKKYKITLLLATVFHVKKIMNNLPTNQKKVMSTLNGLLITGSSVSTTLRKEIDDRISSKLFVFYGINECGIVSVAQQPHIYQVSDTVGFPLKGSKIEVVNDDLKVLPHGETGQIRLKTEGMIDGYLKDEKATVDTFKNGWFYPGDMGKFTENGQLIHLGRADDMMIMAGNNIYPAEIEHCIVLHPNVEDAVSLPIKGYLAQDVPVCAVVLKDSVESTEKELLDYAYQHLASRSPKRIVILDIIERNEQGKLLRKALIEKIQTILSTSGIK